MNSTFRLTAASMLLLVASATLHAQSIPAAQDWHLLDPTADSVQGMGVENAYQTVLKGLPSRTVLVAVIDSGIDIDHEDLTSVIWTNPGEVAGNGIDDDRNGYIDDLHGWSFIGGKGGNVQHDTYELTRELVRLKQLADADPSTLSRKQQLERERYAAVKEQYDAKFTEEDSQYRMYKRIYTNMAFGIDTLKSVLGNRELTVARLDSLQSQDPVILFAKSAVLSLLRNAPDTGLDVMMGELKEAYEYYRVLVEYGLNQSFDPRPIVGDNYADKRERYYGSSDVKGPDADHGTHVAGIIAADRKNGAGIRGIADNVRIMVLRAVPDGDERDKDIANAIIYAVNNGAAVINMSFGKSLSPDKAVVDEAVHYAEKRGVLIIHAAGNEGSDNDRTPNFPGPVFENGRTAKLWIEVGASSDGRSQDLAAGFSNYGKKTVDVFAPGVEIFSTIPGSGYKANSGTSMAAPAVTGVAALLMSYFPNLGAAAVKEILVQSVRRFDGLEVTRPGSDERVSFSDLCRSGGVVNALEAVKLAQKRNAATAKAR
ncbi:MAG: S8 family peptidase [Bacteroidota bacterium]